MFVLKRTDLTARISSGSKYFHFIVHFHLQYGHVSELNSKKIKDEEQHLLELFNLESSKLRILRNSQNTEEEERRAQEKEMENQRSLEYATKKLNAIITEASKEDKEEEAQVRKN